MTASVRDRGYDPVRVHEVVVRARAALLSLPIGFLCTGMCCTGWEGVTARAVCGDLYLVYSAASTIWITIPRHLTAYARTWAACAGTGAPPSRMQPPRSAAGLEGWYMALLGVYSGSTRVTRGLLVRHFCVSDRSVSQKDMRYSGLLVRHRTICSSAARRHEPAPAAARSRLCRHWQTQKDTSRTHARAGARARAHTHSLPRCMAGNLAPVCAEVYLTSVCWLDAASAPLKA